MKFDRVEFALSCCFVVAATLALPVVAGDFGYHPDVKKAAPIKPDHSTPKVEKPKAEPKPVGVVAGKADTTHPHPKMIVVGDETPKAQESK